MLGALVAANTPALRTLDLSMSVLGDAGLGPVCEALARNTHLSVLNCSYNNMGAAFARDVFLPVVRANTSLRELRARYTLVWVNPADAAAPLLLEAETLVAARN